MGFAEQFIQGYQSGQSIKSSQEEMAGRAEDRKRQREELKLRLKRMEVEDREREMRAPLEIMASLVQAANSGVPINTSVAMPGALGGGNVQIDSAAMQAQALERKKQELAMTAGANDIAGADIPEFLRKRIGLDPSGKFDPSVLQIATSLANNDADNAARMQAARASAAAGGLTPSQRLTAQTRDAQYFTTQVKPLIESAQGHQRVRALATDKTGASDYALMTMFIHSLDNSVMRDSEREAFLKANGFINQLRAMALQYSPEHKGFLPDQMRDNIVRATNTLSKIGKEEFDNLKKQNDDIAIISGLDPRAITGRVSYPGAEKESGGGGADSFQYEGYTVRVK